MHIYQISNSKYFLKWKNGKIFITNYIKHFLNVILDVALKVKLTDLENN